MRSTSWTLPPGCVGRHAAIRLFRDGEIVDAAGGDATRAVASRGARHHGGLAHAHEESVLARSEVLIEVNLEGSDAHVLGLDGNFLVTLHARLAAADPAERSHLEFAPVAFLIEQI